MVSLLLFFETKDLDPEKFWNYIQKGFPLSVIRSKGLFWLASRPKQALIWGQAGGSLKAEKVVWSKYAFQE